MNAGNYAEAEERFLQAIAVLPHLNIASKLCLQECHKHILVSHVSSALFSAPCELVDTSPREGISESTSAVQASAGITHCESGSTRLDALLRFDSPLRDKYQATC